MQMTGVSLKAIVSFTVLSSAYVIWNLTHTRRNIYFALLAEFCVNNAETLRLFE